MATNVRFVMLLGFIVLWQALGGVAFADPAANQYGTKTWYFADGGGEYPGEWTGVFRQMSTYYSIVNPNPGGTTVYFWAKRDDGLVEVAKQYWVPGQGRYTVPLLDHTNGQTGFYSVVMYSMTATVEVYPARSSYWGGWPDWAGYTPGGLNWDGSSSESGGGLASDWYFAEAGTLNKTGVRSFQSFLKVFNPTGSALTVTERLYRQPTAGADGTWGTPDDLPGATCDIPMTLGPYATGQYWLAVHNCGWLYQVNGGDISARVFSASQAPFAVDMSLFMANDNYVLDPLWRVGGMSLRGVPASELSSTWYFAEARNDTNWQPRVYIYSPFGATTVRLEYYDDYGTLRGPYDHYIPQYYRTAIDGQFDQRPTIPGKYHLKLTSLNGQLFTAQKVQYWDKDFQWVEPVGVTAAASKGTSWVVPFGATNGLAYSGLGDNRFHFYIFVSNPNTTTRYFRVRWFKEWGQPYVTSPVLSIPANGWYRVHSDDYLGHNDALGAIVEVTDAGGTPVEAGSSGVVVEAVEFWNQDINTFVNGNRDAGALPQFEDVARWRAGDSSKCFKIKQ